MADEQPKTKRGPVPGSERAKHVGQAVRERYGSDFYSRIGRKGGTVVRQTHGSDFYSRIGEKGGQATRKLHGLEHYTRIGRMGGLRSKKRSAQADARAAE